MAPMIDLYDAKPIGLIDWLLRAAVWLALTLLLFIASGCLSKEAQAAIDESKNKTAVALQGAKDAAKLAAEKAKEASDAADQAALDNPIMHPIRSIGLLVKQDRPIFNFVAVVSTILMAIAFGVAIASRFVSIIGDFGASFGKFFGIVFAVVAATCWALLWFGPVAPWIALAILVGGVVCVLIRLHANKWNIGQLFTAHVANAMNIQSVAAQTRSVMVAPTPIAAKAMREKAAASVTMTDQIPPVTMDATAGTADAPIGT